MVKVSTALILVGLAFSFITVPFMGMDLLLDPVGYVFIFNGVRALGQLATAEDATFGKKKKPLFTVTGVLALILAAFSLVQMLLAQSALAPLLQAIRTALVIILCVLLAAGFYALIRKQIMAKKQDKIPEKEE